MKMNVFSQEDAVKTGIRLTNVMPTLELVPRGKYWLLKEDARYCIDVGSKWVSVVIPAGFKSDLDSVPRVPLFYAWLKNRTVTAALLHDALYRIQLNRQQADKAFLVAMKLEGVKYRYRHLIYWGVRLFGGHFYDLARLKNIGETV
jgi:Protein of unknown function (DUF1353)